MGEKSDKVKGHAKQAAGELADDDELKAEGKMDEVAGKAKGAIRQIKDRAEDAVDAVKDRVDAHRDDR